MDEGFCEICDKPIHVKMCCSGRDCGCLGMPIEPPICESESCWSKWEENRMKSLQDLKKINVVLDEKERHGDKT